MYSLHGPNNTRLSRSCVQCGHTHIMAADVSLAYCEIHVQIISLLGVRFK